MKEIELPKPEEIAVDQLQFATEVACTTLVDHAIKSGLLPMAVNPGLMYLPDEGVTERFKEACAAVIDCLKKAEQAAS